MKALSSPAAVAAVALLAGVAVYALARPAAPALAGAWWLGCAPTLLHTFAFTLWTALALRCRPAGAAAVALGGALTAGVIEGFQHPAWHAQLPLALARRWGGTFDPLDLIAAVLGAAAAGWLAVRRHTP